MKIVILGAGRMGGWLAGELRKEHPVAVYDIIPARLEGLKGVEKLMRIEAIRPFSPDLLINAVSLERVISVFREAAPYVPEDCVLGDIASIKREVAEYYGTCGFRFLSIHPMFGPTFTDMESLRDANAIIIEESESTVADFFEGFFARLGVKTFRYSFDKHDRMMAHSLSLPFLSSMAFASCVDSQGVPGTTFAKHMSIARGLMAEDDHLLAEILFNSHSLMELDRVTSRLEYLKHIIRDRDHEELYTFFEGLRKNLQDGRNQP